MDLRGKILKYKYKISELLSVSSFAYVYSAYNRLENNKSVIIKFLRKEGITNRKEDTVRFKSEADSMLRIDHRNIVKLIEIGVDDGQNYLVMEPAAGKCLAVMAGEVGGLSIEEKTGIILQMSDALAAVHSMGIVHKAVNPGNIIVFNDGTVLLSKLINFAIANIRDFSRITERNDIVGTFSYMSPEQSGIIRRNVDGRSDLYSLGIIFYELLTNELPFKGTDVNSIIHHHIAVVPEPPSEINNAIPEILEKIILKLIEKEPEKRYQSASVLQDDLKKFFSGDKNFMAGTDDGMVRLHHFDELIERENEYEVLMSEFDSAVNGKGRVCLISGEPGSGKTRLVDELVNKIYYHAGTFIAGNCIEGGTKTPYGPIKDIINNWLNHYLQYTAEKKQEIGLKLNNELAPLSEILIKMHPMMIEIFAHAPPLQNLRQDREMQRFLLTISRFFYELSIAEKGIVLIFDNLQWIDENSFQLLREIVKHVAEYPLFIIGIFRNSEQSAMPELEKFVKYLQSNNYPLLEIKLMPFSGITMNMLVAGTLHRAMIDTLEVSNFVLKHSSGNPFLAIEILKQLIDEKGLVEEDNKIVLKYEIIDDMRILNSSTDIIQKRISLLNEKEKQILAYASVIGIRFDMESLFKITEYCDEDVIAAIDRAHSLQLIKEDIEGKGFYAFTYGSIHNVLNSGIPPEKQKLLHLTVARLMEEMISGSIISRVYDIAHHYIEADEKEKICEYAYPAGIKAMENYANDDALKYFGIVRNIYENSNMEGDALWIDCMKNIGDIHLRLGNCSISSTIYSVLLEYVEDKVSKTNLYNQISQTFFMTGEWPKCEWYGSGGLLLLGEKIPATKKSVKMNLIKEIARYCIGSIFRKKNLQNKDDSGIETYKVIINFYMTLCWMYALSDNIKFFWSVMRMLNISLSIGRSKELGMSMAFFAMVMSVIPFFRKAVKYHEYALRMRRELNDQFGIAQSMQLIGYSICYQGDYQLSIQYFLESGERFVRIGDVWEIAMVKNGLGYNHFYSGNYDEAVQYFSEYMDISQKINDFYGISVSSTNLSLAYTLTGDLDKAENFGRRAIDISKKNELWYPCCFANINYGILMMEKENFDEAKNYLETALGLYTDNNFLKDYTVYLFSCLAEVYTELYKIHPDSDLKNKIKKMCEESLVRTKRWPNHRAAAYRVNAGYYALIGKRKKAEWYYRKSIKHSALLGRKFELARGLYEFGIYYRKTQRPEHGGIQLKAAYMVFNEIKSSIYIKRIEHLLNITMEETPSSIKTMIDKRRMYSIIQVSQDISSIMNQEVLLEKIMMAAIELMGAQSGALFLVNEDTGLLEVKVNKNVNMLHQNETKEFVNLIVQDVFKSGKSIIVMNAMEDEKYSKYPMVAQNRLKSIMCIPLIFKDEVMGVCYLDNPLFDSVFTEDDQDVLSIIMTQAAISIENVRLYEFGITDRMTMLVTHDHFQNLLKKEISKALRFGRELSLVMFDIDHFKIFNDTYGHQAGDEVLKAVAKIIKSSCRDIDTAVRYGGEELMLLLPETSVEKAGMVAERTRCAIEKFPFVYQNLILNVRVSVGVATFPVNCKDASSLIKAADLALYDSKKNGRNMVTVFSGQIDNTQCAEIA